MNICGILEKMLHRTKGSGPTSERPTLPAVTAYDASNTPITASLSRTTQSGGNPARKSPATSLDTAGVSRLQSANLTENLAHVVKPSPPIPKESGPLISKKPLEFPAGTNSINLQIPNHQHLAPPPEATSILSESLARNVESQRKNPMRTEDSPSPVHNTRATAWAGLKTFLELLNASADAFGPLKSVVGGITQCIKIYESQLSAREEYKALSQDLDNLFSDLSGHFGGPTGLIMTPAIENLVRGIETQLAFVMSKEDRGWVKRTAEALDDLEAVLKCYRQIQIYVERLNLNANLNIWRVVDDEATERRLTSLSPSFAAFYDSAESLNLRREGCTENTRVEVREQQKQWAEDIQKEKIYWLNGMAGTGKTTITYSLCDELSQSHSLAASFFCSRRLASCNNINCILPTISYQLARFSRPFRCALSRVLEKNPDVNNRMISEQFKGLIAEPLRLVKHTLPADLVVVIDALDECNNYDGVVAILDSLISHTSELPIRFFVTSRPEAKIQDWMREGRNGDTRFELRLHELEQVTVEKDIRTYLQTKLSPMKISETNLERLVTQCGTLFIYASTVVRYIGYDNFKRDPHRRLETIFTISSSPNDAQKDMDALYTAILEAAFDAPGLEKYDKDQMKLVLYTVICAQEPLELLVIAALLKLNGEDSIRVALRSLLSVLHLSEDSGIVTTFHASFPDYMFNRLRSDRFYCDRNQHNTQLAFSCFMLIQTSIPQPKPHETESSSLTGPTRAVRQAIDEAISKELSYAYQYWAAHLELSTASQNLIIALEVFLSERLLNWISVLQLNGKIHDISETIKRAKEWFLHTQGTVQISKVINDASEFITAFTSSPITLNTPHNLIPSLQYWPTKSASIAKDSVSVSPLTGKTDITKNEPKPQLLGSWADTGVASFSLGGGSNPVVLARSGKQIITGSKEGSIQVWDAHTGLILGNSPKGHKGPVTSVAYSSDETYIISGSEDGTVRIWDAQNKNKIGDLLRGHAKSVTSVAYSHDSTHIISASEDSTIRIWDAQSRRIICEPLTGHASTVTSVEFSYDDAWVVSCSQDKTIRIWDAKSGKPIGEPLLGHTSALTSIASSPDGSCITAGSEDGSIYIWDVGTSKLASEPLRSHASAIKSVVYSQDGTRIISSCEKNTICVWDSGMGEKIQPLVSTA